MIAACPALLAVTSKKGLDLESQVAYWCNLCAPQAATLLGASPRNIFHGISYHGRKAGRDFQIDRMTFRTITEALDRANDYRSTSRPCGSLETLLADLQHRPSFLLDRRANLFGEVAL